MVDSVVATFDYYFNGNINTSINESCTITMCNKSRCFKSLQIAVTRNEWCNGKKINEDLEEWGDSDVIKKDLRENGRLVNFFKEIILNKGYFTACIQQQSTRRHLCDGFLIMIGSKLSHTIYEQIDALLKIDNKHNSLYVDVEIEKTLRGTFISNGILYYASFRDFNNNRFCHYNEILNRTTVYLYNDESRGYMIYSDCDRGKLTNLIVKNKNGVIYEIVNTESEEDDEQIKNIYEDCGFLSNSEWYDCSPKSQLEFLQQSLENKIDIDTIKNKLFISYSQAVYSLFEKINIFENKNIWNRAVLNGNVVSVYSQKLFFEKSKSQANRQIIKTLKTPKKSTVGGKTIKETKKEVSLKRILQTNSSYNISFFTPLDYFHLDKIPDLIQSVQRIKPQNVRSLKALQLTPDSKGFICPFQVGNIGSAGKIVNLVDGVVVSYGCLKKSINKLICLIRKKRVSSLSPNATTPKKGYKIIINNIITKFVLHDDIDKKKFLFNVKRIWPFYEIMFYETFCCINLYNGLLMKKIKGVYMSRKEMEWLMDKDELEAHDNTVHMGRFAKKCDSFIEYTPPSKKMVSVVATKSALPNIAFKDMGFFFNRNNQIYVNNNKRDVGEKGNRYDMLLAFGEIDGFNEGDGYVVHPDFNFNLTVYDNIDIYIRSRKRIDVQLYDEDKRHLVLNRNEDGDIIDTCLMFGKIISTDEAPFIVDYQKILFKTKENKRSVFHMRHTKNDECYLDYIKKCTNPKIDVNVYKYKQYYNKITKEWEIAGNDKRKNYTSDKKTFIDYKICVIQINVEYKTDFYTGLKLINAYGQKGLCNKNEKVKNLIAVKDEEKRPIDVIANVFSFISRSALGQYEEMKRNGLYKVFDLTTNRFVGVAGVCSMWINNNDPNKILSEKSSRHDSLSKPCLVVNGVPLTMNVQTSSNDIHNKTGRTPSHAKYIFDLYKMLNFHYRFLDTPEKSEIDLLLQKKDLDAIEKNYDRLRRYMKKKPTQQNKINKRNK